MVDMLRGLPAHFAATGQEPISDILLRFLDRQPADAPIPPKPTDVPDPEPASLPFVSADRRVRWEERLHGAELATLRDHITRESVTAAVDDAVSVARTAIEALEELQAALGGRS